MIRKLFYIYGYACSSHPWEFILCIMTIVLLVPFGTVAGWAAVGGWKSLENEVETNGGVVMFVGKILAFCHVYVQLNYLKTFSSQYMIGVTLMFTVVSSVLFSVFIVSVTDWHVLSNALAIFFLLIDMRNVAFLADVAFSARSQAGVTEQISQGLSRIGPTLSLDTVVKILVLWLGRTSGIRQVEQACCFSLLSLLASYITFMVIYPACLTLLLEFYHRQNPRGDDRGSLGDDASVQQLEYSSNPVIERVKIVMCICLTVIHIYSHQCHHDVSPSTHLTYQEQSPVISASLTIMAMVSVFLIIATLDHLTKCVYRVEVTDEVDQADSHGDHGIHDQIQSYLRPYVPSLGSYSPDSPTSINAAKEPVSCNIDSNTGDCCHSQTRNAPQSTFTENNRIILKQHPTASFASASQCGGCCVSVGSPDTRLAFAEHSETRLTSVEECVTRLPMADDTGTNQHIATFTIGDESDDNGSDSENDNSVTAKKDYCKDNASNRNDKIGNGEEIECSEDIQEQCLDTATRSMEESLKVLNSSFGASSLTDDEVIALVQAKHIPAYKLEVTLGDHGRAVRLRRRLIAGSLKDTQALHNVPYHHYDYTYVTGACCENVVGYIPVPLGVAGPLLLNDELYHVPMATTEGTLVASTNRGCRALSMSGGVSSVVIGDGMTRGPVVRFHTAIRASQVKKWLEKSHNFDIIKASFDETSRYADLTHLHVTQASRHLFIRFVSFTGDAMGMNMVSKGVERALFAMTEYFPDMQIMSLSGNYCTDKKSAALNWIAGRGKSVVAEAVIPEHVVQTVLKTSVAALVELNVSKNLIGSAMAGSVGGFNAHAANIVTSIFIATGQDPAQNITSSNCITLMEATGPTKSDLYISCTMPSLELGTVGGGTVLPPQAACLQMMGLCGSHSQHPGLNAGVLAQVVCGTVLAGELSLMSALTAGHLVKSHMTHNRSSVNISASCSDEIRGVSVRRYSDAAVHPQWSSRLASGCRLDRTSKDGGRSVVQNELQSQQQQQRERPQKISDDSKIRATHASSMDSRFTSPALPTATSRNICGDVSNVYTSIDPGSVTGSTSGETYRKTMPRKSQYCVNSSTPSNDVISGSRYRAGTRSNEGVARLTDSSGKINDRAMSYDVSGMAQDSIPRSKVVTESQEYKNEILASGGTERKCLTDDGMFGEGGSKLKKKTLPTNHTCIPL